MITNRNLSKVESVMIEGEAGESQADLLRAAADLIEKDGRGILAASFEIGGNFVESIILFIE